MSLLIAGSFLWLWILQRDDDNDDVDDDNDNDDDDNDDIKRDIRDCLDMIKQPLLLVLLLIGIDDNLMLERNKKKFH